MIFIIWCPFRISSLLEVQRIANGNIHTLLTVICPKKGCFQSVLVRRVLVVVLIYNKFRLLCGLCIYCFLYVMFCFFSLLLLLIELMINLMVVLHSKRMLKTVLWTFSFTSAGSIAPQSSRVSGFAFWLLINICFTGYVGFLWVLLSPPTSQKYTTTLIRLLQHCPGVHGVL